MAIPSHTGSAVRIFYRLIAGVSSQSHSVSTEVIIRILPRISPNLHHHFPHHPYRIQRPILIFDDLVKVANLQDDEGGKEFARERFQEYRPVRDESGTLQLICEQSSPGIMNYGLGKINQAFLIVMLDVRAGDAQIGKISLPRSTWFMGELLTGQLEFGLDSICIYQVKIDLEQIEQVNEAFLKQKEQQGLNRSRKRILRTFEQVCWMHTALSFHLSLPYDQTPSLLLDLCTVSWSLRVHLWCADPKATLGVPQIVIGDAAAATVLTSPSFLRQSPDLACIECFSLEVPLTILPSLLALPSSSAINNLRVAIPDH